jgi:hypothetical protein
VPLTPRFGHGAAGGRDGHLAPGAFGAAEHELLGTVGDHRYRACRPQAAPPDLLDKDELSWPPSAHLTTLGAARVSCSRCIAAVDQHFERFLKGVDRLCRAER